jgi:hypothetical protein
VPKTSGSSCSDDGNPCTTDVCDGAGACLHAAGNAGATCRVAAGACDVAETCDGTNTACPPDVLVAAAAVCRPSQSGCDPQETCTGSSAACPADVVTPNCGDVTLTTPAGVSFEDVTVGATAGISVELNANVSAVTKPAVITNMASGSDPGIKLFPLSVAGTAYSSSTIVVQSSAQLTGDALSPSVVVLPGGTVTGTVNQSPTLTPPVQTTFTVVFPQASSGDVLALPIIPRTLDPGRYGAVTVSPLGTLRLRTGTYYVDSLSAPATSTIEVDDSAGPVILYTRLSFDIGAVLEESAGSGLPSITIVDIGSAPSFIRTSFRGAVAAPLANIELDGVGSRYTGAFFGKYVEVESGVSVAYAAPNDLVPLFFPPTKGIQDCANGIRPSDAPPSSQKEADFQTEIAKHCTAPEVSSCVATLIGRSNADYTAVALQTVNHVATPSQYIAISRDRRRKLTRAKADPAYAAQLCGDGDSDHDWIPDSADNCPGTPDLTATDDNGCPLSVLPDGPSVTDLDTLLQNANVLINPFCRDAPAPTTVAGAAVWQTANPGNGVFIVSTAVTNQPQGCTVWYVFEVRILDSQGLPMGAPIEFAYPETQKVAHIGGLDALPLMPPNYVEFVAKTTDPDQRAILAGLAGKRIGISFRVQAVNGRGARGPWSDWKRPTETDCLQLGVYCAQ